MAKLVVLYPHPTDADTFERRYRDEHGPTGEVPVDRVERERARHDVVSRQLVHHVDQHGLGADAEDGSLHRAHVVVLQAEVGQERDQRGHAAILAARPTPRTVA